MYDYRQTKENTSVDSVDQDQEYSGMLIEFRAAVSLRNQKRREQHHIRILTKVGDLRKKGVNE